mgnify:CR=1 FL=1
MTKERVEPTLMDNMLESLANVNKGEAVTLDPVEASPEVVYERITAIAYGLLLKKTLTVEEISLLGILLKAMHN